MIVISYFDDLRLEQDATTRDALLVSEKQAHEATKKTLTETLGRNEELIKKIQDSDKHNLQLQLTVERLIIILGSMFLVKKLSEILSSKSFICSIPLNLTFSHDYRLQENASAKEALLLRERDQNNATVKAQEESQERNSQLLKKFEDVDKKIDLLQGTIQRYYMHPCV